MDNEKNTSYESIRFNIDEILAEKMPNRKLPKCIVRYLKRIIQQDELNRFMGEYDRTRNFEFIAGIHKFFNVSTSVYGTENLPHGGRYIFASNHPLGGFDGVSLAYYIGNQYDGKVKIYANDILMFVKPLQGIFIPINKTGMVGRGSAEATNEFLATDNHLITFPAGKCSRKTHGKIIDDQWKKNVIAKSVQFERDIVPVYFQGRNSNFFYNLANLRKFLGIKANIEMLYLADEFVKQRGKHHAIYFGEPISYRTFDKHKTQTQWAQWLKDRVYEIESEFCAKS
ncbi:MAG: 1-acyl-sn-glycerol-3-phosphate acyltransferase [Prevotellaceae bacterium]|jgi:1-acyl-sn-glycerol-3-phosphate acyltransferase|nr:1-acyl-sn-glycerol-3-phosphate acyltransferase [Prevotellaceae bacterium]